MRTLFALLLLSTPALVDKPQVHRDLAYAEPKNERQTLDVYAPKEGENHPVVFWIHGGDRQAGDKKRLAEALQQAGVPARAYAAQGKTHGKINADLGKPGDEPTKELYEFVDAILAKIDRSRHASAVSDDPPRQLEKKYAPMPWHLVDTWWDIGNEIRFESLAVDVTISDDVPSSVNLYIAPIGLGHLSTSPFYGGIQTHADGYTKKDQNLRQIGTGFLFSMWGERSHDAIRPSEGGFFQSSGHEGDFVSVRRPFRWKKGKYTYRLNRMDQQTIDGKPYTWVGAFVYSHENDENLFVGALRFKGEDLILDRKVANFVEVYGRRRPV